MADTNIESLQADYEARARQEANASLIRQVLHTLSPQHDDARLDYAGLLHRLEEVVAKELNTLTPSQEGAPDGTVRSDDGSPDCGDDPSPGP